MVKTEIIGDRDIRIEARRNFFAPGFDESRSFELDDSRDWVVGFFDISSQAAMFSDVMTLNFDNGFVRDTSFEETYDFVAIPEGDDGPCHTMSNCHGWSLDGSYNVKTNMEGESSLRVEAYVHSPTELN